METTYCRCGCGTTIPAFSEKGTPRVYLHGHQGRGRRGSVELISCGCGCGETIPSLDRKGRPRRFRNGHGNRLGPSELQRRASAATLAKVRPIVPWNKGTSYIIDKGQPYANKGSWMLALRRRYGPACMNCGWDAAPCDTHHIIPRRDGGLFTIENGVILCPNCHRLADLGILTSDDLASIRATAPTVADIR